MRKLKQVTTNHLKPFLLHIASYRTNPAERITKRKPLGCGPINSLICSTKRVFEPKYRNIHTSGMVIFDNVQLMTGMAGVKRLCKTIKKHTLHFLQIALKLLVSHSLQIAKCFWSTLV